jgi:hypothetical protein
VDEKARTTVIDRIAKRTVVDPDTGCWLWQGALSNGYGTLSVGKRSRGAHRLSYEAHRGEVPRGLEIDHLCRVRCCVNPDHLEPVTHVENVRRGAACALRPRTTHCPRGHERVRHEAKTPSGSKYCALCRAMFQERSKLMNRQITKYRRAVREGVDEETARAQFIDPLGKLQRFTNHSKLRPAPADAY